MRTHNCPALSGPCFYKLHAIHVSGGNSSPKPNYGVMTSCVHAPSGLYYRHPWAIYNSLCTPYVSKTSTFYFLNNSVKKNQQIWIISAHFWVTKQKQITYEIIKPVHLTCKMLLLYLVKCKTHAWSNLLLPSIGVWFLNSFLTRQLKFSDMQPQRRSFVMTYA